MNLPISDAVSICIFEEDKEEGWKVVGRVLQTERLSENIVIVRFELFRQAK